MKKHTATILSDYDQKKSLLVDFTLKCKTLIIDLLEAEGINLHQITERVKEKHKLEGKILKKNHKYTCLDDITDVAGIRIITYFEDEVEKIAELIAKEFQVDSSNSIDKRKIDDDKFGYRSLHYVLELSSNRLKLPEYKRFKNLKFELQIRTILQHSWAEIEHDIGYKGEIAIPQFAKRTFYRVAALLETADLEFVKLKDLLKDYENNVATEIISMPETVQINQASLLSFISTNQTVKNLDAKMAAYAQVPLDDYDGALDELLQLLKQVDINNIKELESILKQNEDKLYEVYKKHANQTLDEITAVVNGISLFQIRHL